MVGKDYMRNEIAFKAHGYDGMPMSTNRAIMGRDRWMVSMVDIIFVNLLNAKERVSIGSVCELAWAFQSGKHTVAVIGKENIHNHSFILEMCDIIFETFDEAIAYFIKLGEMQVPGEKAREGGINIYTKLNTEGNDPEQWWSRKDYEDKILRIEKELSTLRKRVGELIVNAELALDEESKTKMIVDRNECINEIVKKIARSSILEYKMLHTFLNGS